MSIGILKAAVAAIVASGTIAMSLSGTRFIGELTAAPTVMEAGVSPSSLQQAGWGDSEFSFYFTRAVYGGAGSGRGRSGWRTDWPTADRWIINVLRRLTGIDIYPGENAVVLDDPDLRRFPFIYALEMHSMSLPESEVQALREYLLAGGFLMVDDFWGSWQWRDFESQIRRVLPEFEIVELPMDHEIFSSYYKIDEILQVPNVRNGTDGGPTYEQDGFVPHCYGIFDDTGRLMVVINWNTDIGDAWEHAENPYYPLRYSTYAYQMAANTIVYAMTH